LSGVCANLVGIGLARFAYTPLIPALIIAGWFSPTQAAYLGAANLAGYLVGALLARPLASRMTPTSLLRAAMLLTAASFPASAYPLSFAWFFAWRFAAGFGGGALMVVAAPVILRHVPVRQRGMVSGVMFAGVGLGIAASGTLVALLLRYGLAVTWNVLGVLALLLTAVAWNGWPQASERDVAVPLPEHSRAQSGAALRALHIGYGLSAVGLVPPMVFLVDFIARANHLGVEAGARYWTLFGFAAIAGPVLLGSVADRIGFRPTLRALFTRCRRAGTAGAHKPPRGAGSIRCHPRRVRPRCGATRCRPGARTGACRAAAPPRLDRLHRRLCDRPGRRRLRVLLPLREDRRSLCDAVHHRRRCVRARVGARSCRRSLRENPEAVVVKRIVIATGAASRRLALTAPPAANAQRRRGRAGARASSARRRV
jgi:Uncharacterised MFS-type transporter YbfB